MLSAPHVARSSDSMNNGLTPRQDAFVRAYAKNGMNGTAAADEAGYGGDEGALAAAASRMLRLPKIQKALTELTKAAVAKVEKDRRGTIATLAECLEHLTVVQRANVKDYLTAGELDPAKLETAPPGLFRITPKGIDQESSTKATAVLVKHHTAKAGEVAAGALAAAIRSLPTEHVVRIARAMFEGQRPKVIDVPARVTG